MPRKSRRPGVPGGANRTDLVAAPRPGAAPSPAVPQGLPYGQHQQMEQLRAALPSPGSPASPAAPSGPGAASGVAAPGPPAPTGQARAEAAIAALTAQSGGGLLRGPSRRPNEPVTAGLSLGAGPGPEALGAPAAGRVEATLRRLAESTGQAMLAQLADEAATQGL